jgi:PHD/YefM family antitoxin component YafN of YafNO toxin-antitoxin module
MSRKVSVRRAQDRLTELLARAEQAGERFAVERNGQPLRAIVGVTDLERIERLARDGNGESVEQQARKLAKKLGRRYTLPPEKAKRLKELVEKEDNEERLTAAEKRELKQLLKEHEELMVKRAQALNEVV